MAGWSMSFLGQYLSMPPWPYFETNSASTAPNLLAGVPINEGCTLTFQQHTLPSGQQWGATVYTLEAATQGATGALVWVPVGSGTHHTGTESSIQAPNLNGQAFTYSVGSPIGYGPDITFSCGDTVLVSPAVSNPCHSCSIAGAAVITGPGTVQVNYGESHHIPTTATTAPGSSSTCASNPNGVTLTVTEADSNTAVSEAPNGYMALGDGGAGGRSGMRTETGPVHTPHTVWAKSTRILASASSPSTRTPLGAR